MVKNLNGLLAKYKGLSIPVKASLWFIVCGFLQKAIAFITTPIFTRIMTEQNYGQYSTYIAWLNIFTIIASLNLSAGVYTKGIVKFEEDEKQFSSSMLSLSTVCITIVLFIFLGLYSIINKVTDISIYLAITMFVEIWVTSIFHFWSARERVNLRYKRLVVLTLIYVLFSQLLAVLAVLNIDKAKQVEARAISITVVGIVLFVPMLISILKKGKKIFIRKYWIYALKFNLPLVPHYLSQIVLNESDKVMIKWLCGANYAGYYSVAYALAMVMLILNNSISGVMNPWIYKSIKKGEQKNVGKKSYYILAIIAVVNFMVIAVAPEILNILAPGSYQQALWVIPPVTASVYFMFLYNLFATFEYYFDKTHYVMISSLVCAVLNVALNYIFIQKFGFVAAGYTTLFCYVLVSIMHYVFMRITCKKHLNNEKIYNAGIILLIGMLLVGASAVMVLLYSFGWYFRYITIAIIFVVVFMLRKKIIGLFSDFRKKEEK